MSQSRPDKTITVAIPTLGRFSEVRDTVEGILHGTRLPDEILVSDQNRPSLPELDDYLTKRSPLIRHLKTEPKGVVFNMNTLLREAKSDVILYVDDDIVPTEKLVEAHLLNYTKHSVVAVAGRVEQPSGDLPPESIQEVGQFSRWTGKMIFHFNGIRRQNCVFAQGANMSFDRNALSKNLGFDEGFIGNGYFFESEGSLRLETAFPGKMVFDPEASLQHLADPRGGARVHDRSQHHAYFVHNAVRLYRRHCPTPVFLFLVVKLFLLTIAKSIFRLEPAIFVRGLKYLGMGLRQNSAPLSHGLNNGSRK